MAFTKIRETIQAFKQKPESTSYISSADRALAKTDEQIENGAIDILIFAAILAISMQIGKLAHWIFRPEAETFDKYVSTIVGMVTAFIIGVFHERILAAIKRHIPDQRIKKVLDPYFGSKIRQTVEALKKPS